MCYPFIIALNVAGAFRKKKSMTIMSRASSTINRDPEMTKKRYHFYGQRKKNTILGAPEKQVLFWTFFLCCCCCCHNSFLWNMRLWEVGQQRPFHLPRHQSSPPPSPRFSEEDRLQGLIGLGLPDRVRQMSMFAVKSAAFMHAYNAINVCHLGGAAVQCRYNIP
jgi:hypothetical protein